MELAELQVAWNTINTSVIEEDRLDEQAVSQLLRKKSNAELSNLKRALHFKFIMAGTISVICIVAAFLSFAYPEDFHPLDFLFSASETTLFYITLAIALLTMLRFNLRAYREIKIVQSSTLSLKESLQRVIKAMETAISFNIYSDTFMSPVFFTWFYYAIAYKNHALSLDLRALILVCVPIVVGLFSYYFQRFMQQMKFGNYVDRLREYLEEVSQEN